MSGYLDYRHCDHCNRDTLQHVVDGQHERDSSMDTKQCLVCRWTWSGLTGDWLPPAENDQVCTLPPAGWWCSRPKGHGGPCPTRPDKEKYAP